MAITSITDSEFKEKVLESKLPVFVDFWAPWCGPCKLAEPVLEDLSEAKKDTVHFMKVNVDENPEFAGKYGVMSIPTTILFKEGTEIGRQIGFAGKAGFENVLKKIA